ncbi:hypothetical protein DFP72DRAFT_50935 [Ephemerocybe angulata]|uniref:Uncharacterized protein n=1 Tax=Ephemerocybe angulata TaxID=980116 RepID=A0A8H6HFM8_9AGAR|nr:hypothetical protein DFP72DRAFT_50935 [Tulosesus angulatus]
MFRRPSVKNKLHREPPPIQYNQFPSHTSDPSGRIPLWSQEPPRIPSPNAPRHKTQIRTLRRASSPDVRTSSARLQKRPVVLLSPVPNSSPKPLPQHPKVIPFMPHAGTGTPPLRHRESEGLHQHARTHSPQLPSRQRENMDRKVLPPSLQRRESSSGHPEMIPQVVNLDDMSAHKSSTKRSDAGGAYHDRTFRPSSPASSTPRAPSAGPKQVIRKNPEKFRPLPKSNGKTRVGRSVVRLDGEVLIYGGEGVEKAGLMISPSQMS